jgi:predicted nuclease of predicted toxin-antitoxin system
MKILLDENLDVRFKKLFASTGHEIYTVRDMMWNGVKNGALLKLLKENGFECWIVVYKNLPYQQNLANLPCSIIVLDVIRNTLNHITPLVPQILEVLDKGIENRVHVVRL